MHDDLCIDHRAYRTKDNLLSLIRLNPFVLHRVRDFVSLPHFLVFSTLQSVYIITILCLLILSALNLRKPRIPSQGIPAKMSIMAFLLPVIALLFGIVAYQLLLLFRNYRIALKTGLPILITPFSIMDPIWILAEKWRLTRLFARLPFGLGSFIHYSTLAWPFHDRCQQHQRHGPAFMIVSPNDIRLIVADPEATRDIVTRSKHFIKPAQFFKPFEIFGPNVDTVNGALFSYTTSSLVWDLVSEHDLTICIESWRQILLGYDL